MLTYFRLPSLYLSRLSVDKKEMNIPILPELDPFLGYQLLQE